MEALLQGKEQDFARVYELLQYFCLCYFQRVDGYSNMEALLQGKEQNFPRVYEFLQYFCLCYFQRVDGYSNMETLLQGKEQHFPRVREQYEKNATNNGQHHGQVYQ